MTCVSWPVPDPSAAIARDAAIGGDEAGKSAARQDEIGLMLVICDPR